MFNYFHLMKEIFLLYFECNIFTISLIVLDLSDGSLMLLELVIRFYFFVEVFL